MLSFLTIYLGPTLMAILWPLSLIGNERQETTVIAIDDTIYYLLSKDKMKELLDRSPAIAEYFVSYLSRFVDKTYREMHKKSLLL